MQVIRNAQSNAIIGEEYPGNADGGERNRMGEPMGASLMALNGGRTEVERKGP